MTNVGRRRKTRPEKKRRKKRRKKRKEQEKDQRPREQLLDVLQIQSNLATLTAKDAIKADSDRWLNGVWFGIGTYYWAGPWTDGISNAAKVQMGLGKEKDTGENGLQMAWHLQWIPV